MMPSERNERPWKRVALVGSPNSGKTTLFNALTGLKRKIANYAGVTVEHDEGQLRWNEERALTLIDLPGVYSLQALSADESVTTQALIGEIKGQKPPDAVLVVADATLLKRALPLLWDVAEVGIPLALVLTMIDELKAKKGAVDAQCLSQKLGIPVIGVVGHKGIGLDDLKYLLAHPEEWGLPIMPDSTLDEELNPLCLEGEEVLVQPQLSDDLDRRVSQRFQWSDQILESCFSPPQEVQTLSDRIDQWLLHPVWGILAFAVAMFFFFQMIFSAAAPIQEAGEWALGWIAQSLETWLSPGIFRSIVVNGMIAGVGSVIVFIPQVAMVLLMIYLLEGLGYMARAAFLIDRVMGWAGLEGRSFIALLSSYACAVPGIMATRVIPDPKSRLATILVAPLMTCSARLPVYTLMIAAFVPNTLIAGIFSLQALTLFGLYLIGSISALLVAAIFKKGLLRGKTLPFYMELPPYRLPTLKSIGFQVWQGVLDFLHKAGTIILAASLILWVLLNFPNLPNDELSPQAQAQHLEESYAADIGHAVEPLLRPLGFDWKISVALLASFSAREVFVSTLGQIYAHQGEQSLASRLKEQKDHLGNPIYTLATAWSILIFFVFSLQCMATLAVIRRETSSWKWPAFAWAYALALAYVASLITYQGISWISHL